MAVAIERRSRWEQTDTTQHEIEERARECRPRCRYGGGGTNRLLIIDPHERWWQAAEAVNGEEDKEIDERGRVPLGGDGVGSMALRRVVGGGGGDAVDETDLGEIEGIR